MLGTARAIAPSGSHVVSPNFGRTRANVDPRIRALRVTLNVDGPTLEQAEFLGAEFSTRCPIFTTLARSAPIEVTNVLVGGE